jgi:hypothetical protein
MHTDAVSESTRFGWITDKLGSVVRCKIMLTNSMLPVDRFYQGHNVESIL